MVSRYTKEIYKWYLAIGSLILTFVGFGIAADAALGTVYQDWGWGITGIGALMFVFFLYLSHP